MLMVIYGDPIDGFTLVGPFEDNEVALRYAEYHLRDEPWWLMRAVAPDDEVSGPSCPWPMQMGGEGPIVDLND